VLPSSRTAEQKQKQKQGKAVEQADDCMANVISVICCLGLVLLANGLCFGKQLNLLPLPHSTQPPTATPPFHENSLAPFLKLTLATRLRPLEHFIAVSLFFQCGVWVRTFLAAKKGDSTQ